MAFVRILNIQYILQVFFMKYDNVKWILHYWGAYFIVKNTFFIGDSNTLRPDSNNHIGL